MIKEEFKLAELIGIIIGHAMTVHSALGSGFQEVIYQRALEIEMSQAGLKLDRVFEMPLFYTNRQIG